MKAQLAETKGPEFWRSLEELAGSEEFQEMMHREFPKGASEWLDDVSRRGFLKLMGASLAMAGMTACTKLPTQKIVPYVRQPEEIVPGRPLFYATRYTLGGVRKSILVESNMVEADENRGQPEPSDQPRRDDRIFRRPRFSGCTTRTARRRTSTLGEAESWAKFPRASCAARSS